QSRSVPARAPPPALRYAAADRASARARAEGRRLSSARVLARHRSAGRLRAGTRRCRGAMSDWSGRQVLVTGAGGFIGSHLCEKLVELGADVRAFCEYNSLGSWG